MSQLLEILGSKYPIIQGPIGELNDPAMVAAVSRSRRLWHAGLGLCQRLGQDPPNGGRGQGAHGQAVRRQSHDRHESQQRRYSGSSGRSRSQNRNHLRRIAKKIYPKIKELGMKALHVVLAAPLAAKAAMVWTAWWCPVRNPEGCALPARNPPTWFSSPRSATWSMCPWWRRWNRGPARVPGRAGSGSPGRAARGPPFWLPEESPASRAWKEAIVGCGDAGHHPPSHGRHGHADDYQSQVE
jgi:enoyl-[acyl-carrier protein] reductase II